MRIFRKKNSDTQSRSQLGRRSQPSSSRQPAYHYSQKRYQSDRVYDRNQSPADDSVSKRNSSGRKLFSKLRFTNLPFAAGLILVVTGLLGLMYLSPSVQIDTNGASRFVGDRAALQISADDYMSSSVLNRIKPVFDEQKLEEKLRSEFPEFAGLEVHTYFLRRSAVVSLQFAETRLLLSTGSNLYLLGGDGTVLMDITKTKPDFETTELTLVQDLTGVPLEVGRSALTEEQVRYIEEVKFQLAEKDYIIRTIQLMPGGNELNIRLASTEHYIKFNLFEDARQSSGAYIALREELAERGEEVKEYVDMRIPERAYIK